jgi:hypothetical protein
MSDKQSPTGVSPTVPGGYHSRGVPGEEAVARPRMRVLKLNQPGKRVGLGRPLTGGRGAEAGSAEKESVAGRTGVAAGPAGTLFIITAHASDVLNTPVFHAGEGDEEAVAVFTTADAARRYIDQAGWGKADEVGVLRPADQREWFESAHSDGIRWVMIDPDHDRHNAGEPQPVAAIEGDLAALARSLAEPASGA